MVCAGYKSPHFEKLPEAVEQATKEHIEEIDPVGTFVKEEVEHTDNPKDRITCKNLYELFQSWLGRSHYGTIGVSIQEFSARMKSEYTFVRPGNKIVFTGIKVTSTP